MELEFCYDNTSDLRNFIFKYFNKNVSLETASSVFLAQILAMIIV